MTPREVAIALLTAREPGKTVCPSEVARALAKESKADWRSSMPTVHVAIDQMVADGLVQLSWKGKRLDRRAGPYRIGRPGQL